MQANIFGYRWKVSSVDLKSLNALPISNNVYIISIKKIHQRKRRIVYVGVTDILQFRMKGHLVLKLLVKNMNDHRIEICYRDFKGINNSPMERKMIKHYKPHFNRTWRGMKHKIFLSDLLSTLKAA